MFLNNHNNEIDVKMPSCCVAYCQSDSRCNTSLVSFLGVPKDQSLFEEWKRVIPNKWKALNLKSLVSVWAVSCQLHFQEKWIKKANRKHGPRRLRAGSIPILSLTRKQRVDLTSCRKIIICLIHCSWIKSFPSGHGKSSKLVDGLLSTWWIDYIKADKNCAWIGWYCLGNLGDL
jgi:hypothetical protein